MLFFFTNDLIQLYCLRHVSNNSVFIFKKTVQAAFRHFIMQLYKQSSHCQDVFDITLCNTLRRVSAFNKITY